MSCKYCLPDPSTGEVCPLPDVDKKEDSAKDSSTKFNILRGIVVGLFGACASCVLFFVVDEVPTLDYITFNFCMIFLISAGIYAYDSPVDNDLDQDGDDQ